MKTKTRTLYFPLNVELPDGEEILLHVEATYRPERPAPPCSNPSSPAYADAGDPEELEVLHLWNHNTSPISEVEFDSLDATEQEKIEQAIREEYGKSE